MIKRFVEFIKENKQQNSLGDIAPGTVVRYDGSPYYVVASDDFTLELSKNADSLPGERKNFFVNAVMFSERVFVSE
jgi:hypothetical protein